MADDVRIVHAADIHLDSPMLGLGRIKDQDAAQRLKHVTREAFDNLVQHCLDTSPAALILAGDLYDGDWKDYSTGEYFAKKMAELDDANIAVMLVAGNHDAASVISRSLTLPANVRTFSTDAPQTHRLEDFGLAFHAQSYAHRAVTDNLALRYPQADRGMTNVGILHTQVEGYTGHQPYAPCALGNLLGRGYQYFALGHVHARDVLATDPTTVAYSGNLQGRSVRETGAKGVLDVTLHHDGSATTEFVALDVARWAEVHIDVTGVTSFEEVQHLAQDAFNTEVASAGSRTVVCRIHVTGPTPIAALLAEPIKLRAELELPAHRAGIHMDKIRSSAVSPRESARLTAIQRSALIEQVDRILADPSILRTDPDFKRDNSALSDEISQAAMSVDFSFGTDAHLAEAVREAADRLLARLDGEV